MASSALRKGAAQSRVNAVTLALLLLPVTVTAQSSGNQPVTPPAVLGDVQRLTAPAPRPDKPEAALPARAPADRELAKPTEDVVVDVVRYEVDPALPIELRNALPQLTAAYTGARRSYEDLVEATAVVTRYLQRDLGWYLGYAYLPPQAPKDGVIRIAVLEGRLDQVELRWSENLPVDRAVVESYLARLRPGSILTVRELERVVFLLNDLRGLSARFELREGREWGTASIVVTPRADARWSRRVEADADGSRLSGVYRVGINLNLNSPLGRGDGLSLNAMASLTGGLRFLLAGYTLPVGSDGLKVGTSLSAFQYRLDRELMPLDLAGNASVLSVYSLYPLVRSRNFNLFGLASLEHKRFTDRERATAVEVRKHSNELRLVASGDFRDDLFTGGVSTFELGLDAGRIAFDQGNAAGVAPRFAKLSYGASRLQNLVTNRLLLYFNLRGQQGLRNLDSSQQFRLGGADGVRAFAPGEGNGDSGHVATAELRLLPPDEFFGSLSRELVFGLFYDYGRIQFRRTPAPGAANVATLAGRGVSVAWERPGRFNLRLHLADPVAGRATGDPVVRRPRVYGEFSLQF